MDIQVVAMLVMLNKIWMLNLESEAENEEEEKKEHSVRFLFESCPMTENFCVHSFETFIVFAFRTYSWTRPEWPQVVDHWRLKMNRRI